MNKLKEIMMKDLGWKLFSLFIAMALWFMVINIENPVETRNYTVMLGLQNVTDITEKGYVISNQEELENTKVTIKVKGQRMSLDRLGQHKSDISASIDFSKITDEMFADGNIKLYVSSKLPTNLSESYEVISVNPGSLNIVLNKVNLSESEVVIKTIGDIAPGYVLGKPQVTPETVELIGIDEDLKKVSYVGGEVDVTGLSGDYTGTVPINAYDVNGNVIQGVKLSSQEAEVKIIINKSKSVPIEILYSGTPAEGHMVSGISLSPETVELVGSEEQLKGINRVKLPDVVVTGLTESISKTYDIREFLPDGVSIKNGNDPNAVVVVDVIKAAEKELFVSYDRINVIGEVAQGCQAVVDNSVVTFYIFGEETAVNSVDINTIEGEIDVTGLIEGGHLVSIDFKLPEGVEIVGEKPRTVVTIVRTETEDQIPPENEPTEGLENEPATSVGE